MKHLILLNPTTPVGKMYAAGNNDGVMNDHPVLRCLSLDFSTPGFVHAERESQPNENQTRTRQDLYLPTSTIAIILGFDGTTTPAPIGFVSG